MLKKILAKVSALLVTGLSLGEMMHRDYLMWHLRGRDLYLASKLTFFDKHIAVVQPWLVTVIVMTFLVGICVALYETIQLLVYKAFMSSSQI
jgi:hypothetical protein